MDTSKNSTSTTTVTQTKETNVSQLSKERQRTIRTQSKLAEAGDEMSQLVDRITSKNFQG